MVSTSTAMKLSVANSQFQRRPRLAGPASPLVVGKGTDTFRYLVAQIEHVLLLLQIAAGRIESACAELKLSDKSTEVLAVAHSLSGALELQIDGQTYRGPYTSGTKLGPYEILERIGAGGMGEVYRALDSRLNRIVAVKRLTSRHPSRFHQEARAIARLNHPNICILYDVGPDYLVMEYVEGRPFKGPLPLEHVLRIGVHIASAIEAAHLAGVLHRDLKPANILITSSGVVKLLDFGLAKLIGQDQYRHD